LEVGGGLSEPVVKIDASQVEALAKKLERWARVAPNEVKKVLTVGAEMVRKEAQTHFRVPKMERGVGDPTNAWLGTAAANQGKGIKKKKWWTLRDSINFRVTALENGKFSAVVGTNIPYAKKHEFGLEGMPERPFMRPSLEKKRPEVFKMIEEAFMKSYGK
jgi:HK97 gp10 family phage protein